MEAEQVTEVEQQKKKKNSRKIHFDYKTGGP